MFKNNSTIFYFNKLIFYITFLIPLFLYAGGYYTLTTRTGVRVIALNTNMYYKDPLTKYLEDPADQLAWLDDQLTAAASNNEKVSSGYLCDRLSELVLTVRRVI